MTNRVFVSVMLLFVLPILPAYAAECKWAEGKGEVAIEGITPAEARNLAISQARSNAIEKEIGAEVKGESLVKDYSLLGDFIRSLSRGYIREEKVIRWEQDKFQPSPQDLPIPIFRVFISACVEPSKALKDKWFQVKVNINKTAFNEGEKASLTIKSSRKAYINIFNLTAEDKVQFYHQPPYLNMPIAIDADETISFPAKGVSLEMSVPRGHKRAAEAFIIVATTDNVSLPLVFDGKTDMSLTDFYNGLLSVEGDVVEEMVVYSVERR